MKSRALSMAKQRTESSEGRATPSTDLAASVTPVPAATLHVTFTVIAKGDVLHRVHQDKYQPDQFNPGVHGNARFRSEEHTSELQSLMRISYAVFCLKKKNKNNTKHSATETTKQTETY